MRSKRLVRRRKNLLLHIGAAILAVLVIFAWIFEGAPDFSRYFVRSDVRQFTQTRNIAFASTAGPNTLGAAATATGWTNVSVANLNTDAGGTYAVCNGCSTTNWAKLTQFGFSVPSTGSVVGITVTTNGNGSGSTAARREFRIALSKDGTNTAGNAKTAQQFATTDSDITSGSSSDVWGTTFTPAEVNATTFGVFWADDDSTSHALNFDYVSVTITYNTPYDATWVTGAADFKIYQSSSTTWDAGTLICSGTLTDNNNDTIACTSGSIAANTQYRVQVILKNAGETTATMDGASEYVEHINVKAGWAGTSPTLGSCVFNDVGSDDVATATCSVAFSGNNVRITETGTGSVTIAGAGSEGFAYLITTDSTGAGMAGNNSTSYAYAYIDSVPQMSSKITISGPTSGPTGSFNSAAEKTDASKIVDISIEVADSDSNLSRAKIEYQSGATCTGLTWTKATLQTPITADFNDTGGAPDINNTNDYQVGSTATTKIKTASGSNTVDFDWNAGTDVPSALGTYCLRLTANDNTADQTTPGTITLSLDHIAPSGAFSISNGEVSGTSVRLVFGQSATDSNFSRYRIYYKAGTSGVTESDTEHSDPDLTSQTYNGTTDTTVSGLTPNTAYVFNIWAYDTFGNKTSGTEFTVTTGTAVSGPKNCATFGTNTAVGDTDWPSPGNAQYSDSLAAQATGVFNESHTTYYLTATNCGFNIPTAAVIDGIQVEFRRKFECSFGPCIVSDNSVQIIKGGSISGTDQAGVAWPGSYSYSTYGGSSNLWGLSWSPSDINGSTFGVAISTYLEGSASGTPAAFIEHIRIKVYYHNLPTGTFNSAAQKTDGTGVVDISIEVNDTDANLSKAKVEYVSGAGCTGVWTKATLQTPITADFNDTGGPPDITNPNAYQVGSTATTQIKTASGSNTVDFDWASATDAPTANGTYCLRLTVNDGTYDQLTPATQTLTIDNVAPTAPGNLTSGGTTNTTITLTFGSASTETNFSQYKIYYKQGASGVTESDTQQVDSDLTSITYNGTTNTVVSGLNPSTQYVFNIWAHDSYGHITAATEVAITTAGGFSWKGYGELYSASIDTDSYPTIQNKNALRMKWTQEIPSGCTLEMYMQGTNTGPTPDYSTSSAWSGPYTGTGSTVAQNLTGVAALQGKRYFRYRAKMLSCSSNTYSPTLHDVQIDFD